MAAATAPPAASSNAASAPPLIPPMPGAGCGSGVGVGAGAFSPSDVLSPAAICLTTPSALYCTTPERTVICVEPGEALTANVVGWVPSTITEQSAVVRLTV